MLGLSLIFVGTGVIQEPHVTQTERLVGGMVQWAETNPSNICIFPTDICFLLPHGIMLKVLIRMLIRMLADVRWVGFLPPQMV
jgi:hypothetical protein